MLLCAKHPIFDYQNIRYLKTGKYPFDVVLAKALHDAIFINYLFVLSKDSMTMIIIDVFWRKSYTSNSSPPLASSFDLLPHIIYILVE